jgi:superfamily II DNA helicase RecQ
MPEQGNELMLATRDLETALQRFQEALRASGVLQATGGAVFNALRQWRAEMARSKQVPPYIVATDAVLRSIEAARPKSMEELRAVRGIGENKVNLYGEQILSIVATQSP